MPGEPLSKSGTFLKIIDGNFVREVPEGTPNAERREYEVDGRKGVKFELVFMNWTGLITKITFKTTDYGEMCNIHMHDAIITVNTSSRYFKDFAQRIKNADLSQQLTLHPYSMLNDDGDKVVGVSVQQGDEKMKNYYWDTDLRQVTGGYPEITEDAEKKEKKSYWKAYFAEVEEFLIEELKKIKFLELGKTLSTEEVNAKLEEVNKMSNPAEEPIIEDLPF